ncbi:MAG: ABC transporter ATP-binding protein [Spirochaetales bacterium]|nr:ABC transporter ATP-binding protein [Spirochaetales bacterium]
MIKVMNLTYTYPAGKSTAVDGVSFSIKPGEIFGFLGPSGAGKSTIQKILTGLLSGWKGDVKIQDQDLKKLGNGYFQDIGVAFEFPHFYQKFTGRENLRFFGQLYTKVAKNGKIELNKRISHLLEETGLGEDGDKQAGEYSKGMKMRLNLCRALLHAPKILYLDEPTSGLDPVTSRNIRRMIKAEALEGRTIFLTTHNMEVATELCDRVAFLNDGKLEVVDTPKNLMFAHGVPEVRIELEGEEGKDAADFPLSGLGRNNAFLKLINTREVRSIHSREATLEDVFIKLTGRGLE